MKKVIKIIIWILCILILFAGLYFLAMTVTDYKPKDVVPLKAENQKTDTLGKNEFTIATFNIGYCGLDDKQDFFMDGGTMSRSSSKEKTEENLEGIGNTLKDLDADFIFVQEIDLRATRSFYLNEYDYLKTLLDNYSTTYATNYKVLWVPVPLSKPMGYVNGGLVTFSKYKIADANRYQYPGTENWPRQLAELDRCFIETKIPLSSGKSLILLNSHMSAYDKGGFVRKQQLAFLRTYIEAEYKKGNYVVVGGDFNHQIPGTDAKSFKSEESWPDWLQTIPGDFTPEGFTWGADKNTPSNRAVARAYKEGVNFLSVIDGFLVSPNVEIEQVKGYDLKFKDSDHNPVKIWLKLK